VIRGIVSADGVPTITLTIANRDWTAIVDTGFNGDLELPKDLLDLLDAFYVGRVKSALAGGQTVEEDIYLIEFLFDDRVVQAEASFVSGSQILIGTRLLQDYHLQINFVSKSVQLEIVRQ